MNDYSPSEVPLPWDGEEDGHETGNAGGGSGLPSRLSSASSNPSRTPLVDDTPPSEPDYKKLKVENEISFLECMESASEGYILTLDLELSTQQEKNKLIRSPSLF